MVTSRLVAKVVTFERWAFSTPLRLMAAEAFYKVYDDLKGRKVKESVTPFCFVVKDEDLCLIRVRQMIRRGHGPSI